MLPEPVVRVPAEDQPQPPILPFDYNDAFSGPGAGFYPNRGPRIGRDMLVALHRGWVNQGNDEQRSIISTLYSSDNKSDVSYVRGKAEEKTSRHPRAKSRKHLPSLLDQLS